MTTIEERYENKHKQRKEARFRKIIKRKRQKVRKLYSKFKKQDLNFNRIA